MSLMGTAMAKKFIKYPIAYTLSLVSFMLFFSASGYYLFIFDWHIDALMATINGLFLVVLIGISIGIYAVAEKIKSRS